MNIALDTFCQITHPDQNRTIISKEVPWEMLWSQMLMLSRILPITDHDIQAFISDAWMSFVFKAALAIYSFAVLAPLPMRRKMKSSPALRTALSRFLCAGTAIRSPLNTMYRELPPEARVTVEEYWKRVGETLKVIDAEEDPLAPTAAAGGLIGYGIGGSYDQHLGAKPPARGTGMFGGARQELLWSVMSSSAALGDVQLFEEWDYLLRVDTSTVARV
jgi:SWI/SNF chromatin-remodeling complex subunit SWI1